MFFMYHASIRHWDMKWLFYPSHPQLDEERQLVLIPKESLNIRERKSSRLVRKYLIRWRNLLVEDSMWEGDWIL